MKNIFTIIGIVVFILLIILITKPNINNFNFGTTNNFYFTDGTQFQDIIKSQLSPQQPKEIERTTNNNTRNNRSSKKRASRRKRKPSSTKSVLAAPVLSAAFRVPAHSGKVSVLRF